MLLKKLETLDVKIICPLHGPILKENLEYYIGKYATWSSYQPEEKGVVIAYASIHGNTANAAKELGKILQKKGTEKVVIFDLARDDFHEVIANAFHYDKMILASATYDAKLFPPMEYFLRQLEEKNYQNRTIGLIENGTWAPLAGKCMKDILTNMKKINLCENVVTIRSKLNKNSRAKMEELAEEILSK